MLPAPTVQQQGGGSVSGDQLNTYLQAALNVAQLRSLAGLDNMTVWMLGTTTPNDGGQGPFYWDSAATAPDDGGITTIRPNGVTGAGRWLRQAIAPEGSIPLSQLASIPTLTLLGNNTGGTAQVLPLTVAQVLTMLGITSAVIPAGSIIAFGALAAPAGWLICDGLAVSRATYAALFAVIGTTFGNGDGSTTFNLPDMRGQFARGFDTSGSRDPGRTFGTTQASALQAHQHIETIPEIFNPGNTQQYQFGMTTVTYTTIGVDTAGTGTVNFSLTNDGTTYSGYNPNSGGQVVSNETRPTNVAVSFIIKT